MFEETKKATDDRKIDRLLLGMKERGTLRVTRPLTYFSPTVGKPVISFVRVSRYYTETS